VTPTGVRRILNNAADRALATRHARPRWPFGHQWRSWTWRTFRDLIATHRHA
jgi:hypothetical protein